MSCVSSTEVPSLEIVTVYRCQAGLWKYVPLNHPILGTASRHAGKSAARGLPFVAGDFVLP